MFVFVLLVPVFPVPVLFVPCVVLVFEMFDGVVDMNPYGIGPLTGSVVSPFTMTGTYS